MSAVRWTPIRFFWLIVLPGPVIWSVHFMVVYLATEVACAEEAPPPGVVPAMATGVTLVATALGVVVSIAFAVLAHRRWRAGQREAADGDGERPELAFAGMMLSALSVLGVLAVGLPALWLSPC